TMGKALAGIGENERNQNAYPLAGDVHGLSDCDRELSGQNKSVGRRAGHSTGTASFSNPTGLGAECLFLVLCAGPDPRRPYRVVAAPAPDLLRGAVAVVHSSGFDHHGDKLRRVD